MYFPKLCQVFKVYFPFPRWQGGFPSPVTSFANSTLTAGELLHYSVSVLSCWAPVELPTNLPAPKKASKIYTIYSIACGEWEENPNSREGLNSRRSAKACLPSKWWGDYYFPLPRTWTELGFYFCFAQTYIFFLLFRFLGDDVVAICGC